MTRVNTEQQKYTPWFAKARAACSIVPIARFVGPEIFALKGGGYGCLFSLTGIDEEGLKIKAYRFEGDLGCTAPRFETLSRLLGDGFMGVVLSDDWANPKGMKSLGRPPHSVFTNDLIDEPFQPTRQMVDDLIGFYRERLL